MVITFGFLVVIIVFILAILAKLDEPRRKFHEKHITPLENELKSLKKELAKQECLKKQALVDSKLFGRNFKSEIYQLRKTKDEAYENLNILREEKSDLNDEMRKVRSRLNDWHRRSKGFFGNGGKKIKDDSILGWFGLEQTMAQKENLEDRRSKISSNIRALNEKMSDIYEQQIKPAKVALSEVYKDRDRLNRFKEKCMTEKYFLLRAEEIETRISDINTKISNLNTTIHELTEDYKHGRIPVE